MDQTIDSALPLVLLHGWGLGASVWQPLLPLLSAKRAVLLRHLPGYGGSPIAATAIEAQADAVAATLPAACTLCGWSLGAMVALACAARHPQRIARLILVGGNGRFTANAHWPQAMLPSQLDAFRDALDADATALMMRFAALLNQGDAEERTATRQLRRGLADGLPAPPEVLRDGLDSLRDVDITPFAAHVVQPTLLLHGTADPLMPLAGAQRLADMLPQASLHAFAGAAHAPFVSRPQPFAERLLAFTETAS